MPAADAGFPPPFPSQMLLLAVILHSSVAIHVSKNIDKTPDAATRFDAKRVATDGAADGDRERRGSTRRDRWPRHEQHNSQPRRARAPLPPQSRRSGQRRTREGFSRLSSGLPVPAGPFSSCRSATPPGAQMIVQRGTAVRIHTVICSPRRESLQQLQLRRAWGRCCGGESYASVCGGRDGLTSCLLLPSCLACLTADIDLLQQRGQAGGRRERGTR